MKPTLTTRAADRRARLRDRRATRAERARLRAEIASYRTDGERLELEAILARHTPEQVREFESLLR
jgi:hypothetical protein